MYIFIFVNQVLLNYKIREGGEGANRTKKSLGQGFIYRFKRVELVISIF